MDFKKYKDYIAFALSTLLFVMGMIYLAYSYIIWDDPVDMDGNSIEVNLPIIEWGKYTELSKQYDNGILNQE